MGYKYKNLLGLFLMIFLLCSCSDKDGSNTQNTYYVEFVNSADSLHKMLEEKVNGKVSYYKGNKLIFISLNYVNGKYPDMHYFKSSRELTTIIPDGTRKIKIEFSGNFTKDSTFYSIQRFLFSNKEWTKTGDMGMIKAGFISQTALKRIFSYSELSDEVTKAMAESTY